MKKPPAGELAVYVHLAAAESASAIERASSLMAFSVLLQIPESAARVSSSATEFRCFLQSKEKLQPIAVSDN